MQRIAVRLIRLFLVLAAAVSWPAHAAWQYAPIEFPGIPFIEVFGINDSGHVVGVSFDNFVYDSRKGTFTIVPQIQDPAIFGDGTLAINDSGVLAGAVTFTDFSEGGFVSSKNGAYMLITKPGWDNLEVRGINNQGLITGYAFDNSFTSTVGFIYDPARNTFIDILPSSYTFVQGINSRGDVVGHVTLDAGVACTGCPAGRYGFRRVASGAITFFRVNGTTTTARGITDSGVIVGFVRDPVTLNDKGFVVSLSGAAYQSFTIPDSELLQFPGAVSTEVEGINNAGDIVGIWGDDTSPFHGFIAHPLPPRK
jgi:hypothetical protein